MGLDPNIILQAGQGVQQVNPLQTASQALNVQNQLIQNQSNAQMLRARQAVGPIYQQSIGADGQLDTNKFLANAAANPDTAWMAGDLVKSAQDRANTQVDIDTKRYGLLKQHIAGLQQGLIGLYANPNVTTDDVRQYAAQKVGEGMVSTGEMNQVLATMPQDPSQVRPWLLNQYGQLQEADKQADLYYGKAQQTDTGSAIQQGTESPVTGYHPQGAFQKDLAPSDAAGTVATVGPNGQPGVISKGQFAGQNGIGQSGGAYIPTNGQPMSGAPSAPASPTGTSSTGASGQPAGFMPTGLVPGQTEAMQAAATDNTAQGQSLLKQANDTHLNVIPLIKEAKSQIAVGGVSSGPAAPAIKAVGALASQFGINFNPQGTASQEVAEKVLEQISGRQSTALANGGANSDAKLSSAKAATPNIHLSPLGLQGALATVEGNANAITLQGSAYQAYLDHGGSPANFNKFVNNFNQHVDPFVLQIRALPPGEQAKVFKTMSPAEHQKFNQSAAFIDGLAQKTGWQP